MLLLQIQLVIKKERGDVEVASLRWTQSRTAIRQHTVVSPLNKLVLGNIFACASFPSTFTRCLNTPFQQSSPF